MSLDRLLRPRSIAVIGGGTWCENVIAQCRKMGDTAAVWPVHPSRESICGLPTFRSIGDLPAPPDAAFIGINRDATINAVAELASIGAGGAVCFASGFRESETETGDGIQRERALQEAAGEMTILGPNCYGLINYLDGIALWPDQHGGLKVDRGVALVMQSSNIAINLTMQDRGLPIAYMITVGNQMQTDLASVGRALLCDERVTALGLHIEGIGDLANFHALAFEARAAGKPIVAIKIGKSDRAREATITHTGSMAGQDAGATALFDRLGIGRVSSLPSFLETLKLLHILGSLPNNKIASFSCSGGEASLMADTAYGSAVEFPHLTPGQIKALRMVLGEKVALANPLDYHTYIWGDVEAMTSTFETVMRGDAAMGCVILDFPRSDRCDPSAWEPVIDAVAQTMAQTGKPMAIVSTLKETFPETWALRLMQMGIVPISGLDEAVTAFEVAAKIGQVRRTSMSSLIPHHKKPGRTLNELEAKSVLATYGVSVPRSRQVCNVEAMAAAADEIGFPLVLKGEGFAHKTDAGAVILGLETVSDMENAANAMSCSQYLIEEMITDSVAELLIGVVADPAHGYVLTLGSGGTLTELLSDTASCLIPADRQAISACLNRLQIGKLLNGYRCKPAAKIDAILDVVMAVQSYVEAERPREVEINPLICGTKNAIAADALIRLEKTDD